MKYLIIFLMLAMSACGMSEKDYAKTMTHYCQSLSCEDYQSHKDQCDKYSPQAEHPHVGVFSVCSQN